jgi:chromosomal replication initiation ATPase DnaA
MKPRLTPARLDAALTTAVDIFEVERRAIMGRAHSRDITRARLAVYVALYDACEVGVIGIAAHMNREHSTISSGMRQARERANHDAGYAAAIQQVMQAIA